MPSVFAPINNAQISRLFSARTGKRVTDIRDSFMLSAASAGIAGHSQLRKGRIPCLGGLSLGRCTSASGVFSAPLHGEELRSLSTALGGKQFCCVSSSETQPYEGNSGQMENSKVFRMTIYDKLETERITVDLFPELRFNLDGNFYPKLVPLVAKKINTFLEEEGREDEVLQLLELLGLKLSPHIVGEVVKFQKDREKALHFFEWAGSQPGFQHNAHSYNLMFWNLISNKHEKPANLMLCINFLEEMMGKNLNPGPLAWNILVSRLCKDHRVGTALKLMRDWEREDFPDLFTYNSIVSGLAKAGLFKEVFDLLHDMRQKGITPNRVTYNSIIHGLGNAGRWQEAFKVFEKLPSRGITPDVISYNSLIFGLFKCRQVDEVYKVYGLMELRGCQPDRVTFNILIDGLGKSNRCDEAWRILDYMKLKGCEPDVCTYNSLIRMLISNCDEKGVSWLVRKMVEEGCKPSDVTYRLLSDMSPGMSELLDQLSLDVHADGPETSERATDDRASSCREINEQMMGGEMQVFHS